MIEIDGATGEGGGQMLRSSLALSVITAQPFRMTRVRALRRTPGLLRQHLTAVLAAAQIGGASVEGAELGSQTLTFVPRALRGGEYAFDIGSAGSAMLVLQTILVPLLVAKEPSLVTIEGGTHNPQSPSFDFLVRSFLPLVARMGARVEATLERAGFYPAGGGRAIFAIEPATRLARLELLERGAIVARRARAVVANLPQAIAAREIHVVAEKTGWPAESLEVQTIHALGPGNVLTLEAECEHVTEVVTGFGQRGVRAEEVALRAVEAMQRYLDSRGAVGEHLADQLLLPMAIGGGGVFTTIAPSTHTTTNAEVIRKFVDVGVRIVEDDARWRIDVSAP